MKCATTCSCFRSGVCRRPASDGKTRAGGRPPPAASDLAIFDGDRDASQADALVTAAGDGLDLVSTAFKKKILTVPQPICLGNLRFQITGNGVNNATGTIWLFIEELRWK